MRTMTVDEAWAELQRQGVPKEHMAVVCPMCGTVQSPASLAAAMKCDKNAVLKYWGFSCVGRFTGAGSPLPDIEPGHGCNWTLGGLLSCHKLEIIDGQGRRRPHFELASPDDAKALMVTVIDAAVATDAEVSA